MRIAAFVLLAAAAPAFLLGDTLALRNGTVYKGTFLSGNRRSIYFRDNNGMRHRVPVDDVQSLNFYGYGGYGEANRMAGPASLETIPAGATIVVSPNEYVDSTQPGQVFPATIGRSVMDTNGNVIIPAGSHANLVVRTISPGDRYNAPVLGLDLQSVWVNGQQYFVSSTDLTQNNGRTVLGGLLGGLLGTNVATTGTELTVPANTNLTFQLNTPLRLEAQ